MRPYIFERAVIFQSLSVGQVSLRPLDRRQNTTRAGRVSFPGPPLSLVANFSRVQVSRQRYSVGGTSCPSLSLSPFPSFRSLGERPLGPLRLCVRACRTSAPDKCTYLLGYRFANASAVKAAR